MSDRNLSRLTEGERVELLNGERFGLLLLQGTSFEGAGDAETSAMARDVLQRQLAGSYAAPAEDRRCQWIEGDPGPNDSCKCGEKAVPGQSWCDAHFARAFEWSASDVEIRLEPAHLDWCVSMSGEE